MGAEIALLGSAILGVAGSELQRTQQRSAQDFQNAVLRQQAGFERQRAALEAAQFQKDQERLLGRQAARFANAGVELNSGSPADAIAETEADGAFQRRLILAGGELESQRLLQQAALNTAELDAFQRRQRAAQAINAAARGLNAYGGASG